MGAGEQGCIRGRFTIPVQEGAMGAPLVPAPWARHCWHPHPGPHPACWAPWEKAHLPLVASIPLPSSSSSCALHCGGVCAGARRAGAALCQEPRLMQEPWG